jgi:hypothetical protein
MQQHVFFQNIGRKQATLKQNSTYLHNSTILEIVNNWFYIKQMMHKYKEEKLHEVDILEKEWFDFILQNDINIEKYEKVDKFMDDYLKK